MWTHVFVDPDHTGRGIGSALLEQTMARADAVAQDVALGEPLFQRIWRWTAHRTPHALFLAHGFVQCRLFFTMELTLDAPPDGVADPDGIRIRPFEPGRDEQAVYDTFVDTFADHWGMTPENYERFAHYVYQGPDFDPGLLLVAFDDERMVGFAQSAPNQAEAPSGVVVHGLGVRGAWRGRGIGRALLQRSFAAMYERGLTEVLLDVEAENPTGAVALYEGVGMHLKEESVVYEREVPSPAAAS